MAEEELAESDKGQTVWTPESKAMLSAEGILNWVSVYLSVWSDPQTLQLFSPFLSAKTVPQRVSQPPASIHSAKEQT